MDDSYEAQVGDNANESSFTLSTESLIMSLLGQIKSLEEERDNARVLAARMRERLEQVTDKNSEVTNYSSHSRSSESDGVNLRLAKLLREVSTNMVNDLQQIVMNEEQRVYNLKQLASCSKDEGVNTTKGQSTQKQLAIYREHYEKLLEEAENEKVALRKKLKAHQDLVLDRDVKIKELEAKLNQSSQ